MSEQERGQLALPDVPESEAPAAEKSAKPDQPFGDLSEAARGVVHEPADPRLEKHLARIGLGEAEDETAPRAPAAPIDGGLARQLADLQGAVDRANDRLRTLQWVVIALIAGVALLAVLVLSR